MDSNYHIFKKSTKSKGKTVHKWYCYWNDPVTGVIHTLPVCVARSKASHSNLLPKLYNFGNK